MSGIDFLSVLFGVKLFFLKIFFLYSQRCLLPIQEKKQQKNTHTETQLISCTKNPNRSRKPETNKTTPRCGGGGFVGGGGAVGGAWGGGEENFVQHAVMQCNFTFIRENMASFFFFFPVNHLWLLSSSLDPTISLRLFFFPAL